MALSALNSCQKPTPSVDEQHRQNNREVGPVLQQARQQGRDLDHPGDRPPEEMGEALENADVVLRQGVLAVLRKPPGGLGFTQAGGLSFGCGRGHISRHLGVSVSRAHRPAPQLLQPLCIAADISCLPLWRHHDLSRPSRRRSPDWVPSGQGPENPGRRLEPRESPSAAIRNVPFTSRPDLASRLGPSPLSAQLRRRRPRSATSASRRLLPSGVRR